MKRTTVSGFWGPWKLYKAEVNEVFLGRGNYFLKKELLLCVEGCFMTSPFSKIIFEVTLKAVFQKRGYCSPHILCNNTSSN